MANVISLPFPGRGWTQDLQRMGIMAPPGVFGFGKLSTPNTLGAHLILGTEGGQWVGICCPSFYMCRSLFGLILTNVVLFLQELFEIKAEV